MILVATGGVILGALMTIILSTIIFVASAVVYKMKHSTALKI